MLRAASTFWQFQKRKKYWKWVTQTPEALALLFSKVTFEDPPSEALSFAREPKPEVGYMWNVKCLMDSDADAFRRYSFLYGVAIIAILVGSYFLGGVFLIINAALMLLTALRPISISTQADARMTIFALGLILHRWRQANAAECDKFIEQAYGFRVLYEAVKRVE